MVYAWGDVAPGPCELRLPPTPDVVASKTYVDLHRFNVERRRADAILLAARRANRLEEAATMPPADARVRLSALPGLGQLDGHVGDHRHARRSRHHRVARLLAADAGELRVHRRCPPAVRRRRRRRDHGPPPGPVGRAPPANRPAPVCGGGLGAASRAAARSIPTSVACDGCRCSRPRARPLGTARDTGAWSASNGTNRSGIVRTARSRVDGAAPRRLDRLAGSSGRSGVRRIDRSGLPAGYDTGPPRPAVRCRAGRRRRRGLPTHDAASRWSGAVDVPGRGGPSPGRGDDDWSTTSGWCSRATVSRC